MRTKHTRAEVQKRRHKRIRKRLKGTPERPRLCVKRTLRHIYAQVIDDTRHQTEVFVSSLSKDLREKVKGMNKTETGKLVGETIAEMALARNITKVVFDKGGYKYHGRVKALADGARSKGLDF